MTRTILNFWLDTLLLLVFSLLVWSSTVVRFVFPPAAHAAGVRLWGATLDDWIAFQFVVLCVMTVLVLVHVMLHWSWVCGVLTSRILRRGDSPKRQWDDGTRTLYGVGLFILLLHVLGAATAAAVLMIRSSS